MIVGFPVYVASQDKLLVSTRVYKIKSVIHKKNRLKLIRKILKVET